MFYASLLWSISRVWRPVVNISNLTNVWQTRYANIAKPSWQHASIYSIREVLRFLVKLVKEDGGWPLVSWLSSLTSDLKRNPGIWSPVKPHRQRCQDATGRDGTNQTAAGRPNHQRGPRLGDGTRNRCPERRENPAGSVLSLPGEPDPQFAAGQPTERRRGRLSAQEVERLRNECQSLRQQLDEAASRNQELALE